MLTKGAYQSRHDRNKSKMTVPTEGSLALGERVDTGGGYNDLESQT